MSKEFFDVDVIASHTMRVDNIEVNKNNTRESPCEITHVPTSNEEVNVTSITFTSENLLFESTPRNLPLFMIDYAKE